jgi:hypothetical protein
MDPRLDDYDWAELFAAAGEPSPNNPINLSPCLGYEGSLDPFTRADVAEILALSVGENDGPDWLIAVRLFDGRFAFLEGGCVYTGWDCQSSCSCVLAGSRVDLVRYALTDEARERLGLAL